MDIESDLFKEYKEYINNKTLYNINVFNKAPQSLASFPTIIFKESGNSDDYEGKSLNGMEYVDNIMYTVEIYTKDINNSGTIIRSKQLQHELKQLTFEFFRQIGFERLSCDIAEYLDFTVDRLIIIEQAKLNNWNKKII